MAATGRSREQLSRLSKAELIRRIETLRETSRTYGKAEIQKPGAGLASRDSEVLLRHAVQMANLGYWIWDDRENRCIYCSEQLARICGLTVEEYLSKHSSYGDLLGRIHPEDRKRFDEVVSKAVRLTKPYEIEYRVQRPGDGGVRYLREAGEPMLDDEGELAHTVGILQDITEAKRTEEALRESEARFRAMADDLPVMLWVYDQDDRAVFYNRPFLEFVGLDQEAALEWDYNETIHPDDRERLASAYSTWRTSPLPQRIEYRERRVDGAWRRILDVGVPRFAADGSYEGCIGSSLDITEQKQAEAALRDQQQRLEQVSRLSALSQLSAALSREISEPLTAIMNYSAAVRRIVKTTGLSDPDRVVEMLDKAIGQTRQANAVTRHLRELFENVDAEITPQDINEVVDEALALIDPARAGIDCDLRLDRNLPDVRVNRVQIQQVIHNLIKNALEAMATSERRELVVETSATEEGALQVAVSDTGPGLAPAIEPKLFEPFATSKRNGLGLGLSISRGIVEGYGGRLWAEPNPGGGMRFHVTLPAAKSPTD